MPRRWNARLIFMVGDRLETFLAGPIAVLGGDARVIALSEAPGLIRKPFRESGVFPGQNGEAHGHSYGGDRERRDEDDRSPGIGALAYGGFFDMHVWLDPVNAGVMVREIAEVLSEADPGNAVAYAANARGLAGPLDALVAEVAADLAPVRDKPFIVFHDAYRYFEDRFGLAAAGAIAISPERPAGARRVAAVRAGVRESSAACVFTEPQFEPRLVRVVTEGTPAGANRCPGSRGRGDRRRTGTLLHAHSQHGGIVQELPRAAARRPGTMIRGRSAIRDPLDGRCASRTYPMAAWGTTLPRVKE